jgi:hypothetical protein
MNRNAPSRPARRRCFIRTIWSLVVDGLRGEVGGVMQLIRWSNKQPAILKFSSARPINFCRRRLAATIALFQDNPCLEDFFAKNGWNAAN